LDTLLREIDKLIAVRTLGLPAGLFADASEKLVEAWRALGSRCSVGRPPPRRSSRSAQWPSRRCSSRSCGAPALRAHLAVAVRARVPNDRRRRPF
jgi:hypothetical protein